MEKRLKENYNDPDFWSDPKSPKHECLLHVSGTDFDPDIFAPDAEFLQGKKFFSGIIGLPDEEKAKIESGEAERKINEQIEKGELPAEAREAMSASFKIWETPFLLIRISEETDRLKQLEEAAAYLQKYSEELTELCHHPGVEQSMLTFRSEDAKSFKGDVFSKDFYELILKIGIRSMGY